MNRIAAPFLTRRGMIAGLTASFGLAAQAAPLPRILAFGDSLTAGTGLPKAQGLVPVLARWLSDHNTPAQLINAGLSGDTSFSGRVRINWSLRHGADAVIVELGGNDMLLGWSPDRVEPNFDAILKTARTANRPVLLVGIDVPTGAMNWRQDWAEMWTRLAKRHGTLLLPNLYEPIFSTKPENRSALLQPDGIHPSAEGVRLIVDHLGPKVKELVAATGYR